MKKLTAFFTIALIVCIATFVAFASNQNRDVSHSFLIREAPDDFPGEYSDESNTGTDSEGYLWSTASSWSGYFFIINEKGEKKLRYGASGYGYVSCSPSHDDYRTTYSLYAKVPENLVYPSYRNPDVHPELGSFSKSVYWSGYGNGNAFNLGGSSGSASASGKDLESGDVHSTSAASPTPATARDLEIIDG